MAVTRIEVVPATLDDPASSLVRAATALSLAASELRHESAPQLGATGPTAQVREVLEALAATVDELGRAAASDAATLRAARARYLRAERSATAEVRRCG